MPQRKKRTDSSSDTSVHSSDEEVKPAKKAKTEKTGKSVPSKSNSDPDSIKTWDLGGKKFAKARTFRGRLLIDVREYYIDKNDGDLKPGKKGISLSVEQWRKLSDFASEINETVKENA